MSWIPGRGTSSSTSAFGLGGGGGGGGGSGRWINMDTNQIKNMGGELTGENDAFKDLGFELTRQQRLMGFVGCLIGGFVISLLGTLLLLTGSLATFAILYSLGIIVSLIGTGFLIGFLKQLKQMFAPVRIGATAIFLAAFVMVWISALVLKITVLAIVFVVVLYLAYLWYCLSYIPYARSFVSNLVGKFF
ncbi:SFT2-domain-containing protein [Violaceomyces palustris]|uniref:SFT2-domain-containing protein n=1 Tax=Violaceomyces palustris TaxID=1673888 RepID=A0ACD0NNR9_9BASI|nr:SFT2-domain-containing protein [Violaceomyces palustris]